MQWVMRKLTILLGSIALTACVVNVQRGRGQAANDPQPANTAPAATPADPPPGTAPPPATAATPTPTATGTAATPATTGTAATPATTATGTAAGNGSGAVVAPAVAFEEIAEPPGNDAEAEQKLAIAAGRATALVPGANLGVWIWSDANGWHVRTTTKSQQHRFQGVVMATRDATLTDVKPTRLEFNDRLRVRNGRAVAFDFTTNGHEDGFDFKSAGGQCLRFFVKVDGKPDPGNVNLGSAGTHPAKWHFKLCP